MAVTDFSIEDQDEEKTLIEMAAGWIYIGFHRSFPGIREGIRPCPEGGRIPWITACLNGQIPFRRSDPCQ